LPIEYNLSIGAAWLWNFICQSRRHKHMVENKMRWRKYDPREI